MAEISSRTKLLGTDGVRVFDLMCVNTRAGEVEARQSALKSLKDRQAGRNVNRDSKVQMDTRSLRLKVEAGVAKGGKF